MIGVARKKPPEEVHLLRAMVDSNPFVPRDKTLQYVTGSPAGTAFTYRGMVIETEHGPHRRPDGQVLWSWKVSDPRRSPPIAHSGGGVPDEEAAAILARYAGDLELAMRKLGTNDGGTGWDLGNMFSLLAGAVYDAAATAQRRPPTRADVARQLRVLVGVHGEGLSEPWAKSAYEWFQSQSLEDRTKLIDRAVEVRELKEFGMARKPSRAAIPSGWQLVPNPHGRGARGPVINPTTLKKRCLR